VKSIIVTVALNIITKCWAQYLFIQSIVKLFPWHPNPSLKAMVQRRTTVVRHEALMEPEVKVLSGKRYPPHPGSSFGLV